MTDSSRPPVLHIVGDGTPGPHRTDSDDNWWWLPILGPTATVLAYLFARHTAHGDTCWPTDTLAAMTGLAGNRSKFRVSLHRLDRFSVGRFVSSVTLTIRRWLPALTARQVARLPEAMAAAYSAGEQVPS